MSLVIAGGLFALGAFAAELSLDDNDVENMYLAAWAMYAIPSFIDVILSIESSTDALPSSTHHDKGSLVASEGNKKDETYNFIQEVIFAGKEELTRLDVELALLKELGQVSDMLVESMFDSMDEDESGTIDVDEMHHFIHDVGVKKVTCCNGRLCKAF